MFHVERGGVVELWGRQFEKYHFSPTCYRGVSVSRGTWVMPVMKSLASMVVLCRRCWILSRIFLKFMQFVLADGCAVFVRVSVELLGACHLVLCFPGSFSMFHVKRKFGDCGMWE